MTVWPLMVKNWPSKIGRWQLWAGVLLLLVCLLGLMLMFADARPYWSSQGQAIFGAALLTGHEDVCLIDPGYSTGRGFMLLLSAGLLTGLSHCVGMCGPLVGAFVWQRKKASTSRLSQDYTSALILFQSGRLLMYAVLGSIAGALGSLLTIGTILQQGQGFVAIGLGLLLIVMGAGLIGWLPSQRWFQSVGWTRWVGAQMQRLLKQDHPAALLGLGAVNGLLPCGAIYAMTVLAVSTGSALQGALLMLIFGLGTLPAMVGLGLSVGMFSHSVRRYLYQASAFIVLLLGGQLLLRGLALTHLVPHLAIGGVMIW